MKSPRHISVVFLLACLLALATVSTLGQGGDVWRRIGRDQLVPPSGSPPPQIPSAYEAYKLDRVPLETVLNTAPEEYSGGLAVELKLPLPDGTLGRFRIEHSLVVEPGLVKKYPELSATYRGYGLDDPAASARLDLLPNGFHAYIFSANGTIVINPYPDETKDTYLSFFKTDAPGLSGFVCDFGAKTPADLAKPIDFDASQLIVGSAPEISSGTQLRTYRLALAATNEYCSVVGSNTIAGCLAAQVVVMNRVNGIYERDLAMHMNIVANNDLIIYAGDQICGGSACTASNDPYTNPDGTTMLSENQANLDTVIGSANYDIGHVFSTGGGGVAFLAVPCGSSKAGGVTGRGTPIGDPFAVDYVAHEMGHQWGANHTFNGAATNCGAQRNPSTAYEPGSGITIMAYAGICGNQNLAANSIDTFHVKSLEEIVAYAQTGFGSTCAVTTASGNTPPTVAGAGSFNIPKLTPFSLVASATDPNGDAITYDWEEFDLGTSTIAVPNTDSDGVPRPIMRPYSPTLSGTRVFPSQLYILNNANVPPATTGTFLTGELLPAISRTMTFQVVARDNRANAGGLGTATASVIVDGSSGPFAVTSPNTAITWTAGDLNTVTWSVAGTSASPISAANVRISLSTDGGNSFGFILSPSTPNDGSEPVTVPNISSTTTRIKVEPVGNIFFDISDTNFTLVPGGITPTPTLTPTPTATPTSTPITGFEGDVIPRSGPDGIVLATDVTQLRRFATGLDTPNPAVNEAQRADCAPRATFGDGVINSSDVIQGRRYATGLDPLTPSQGPSRSEPSTVPEFLGDVFRYLTGAILGVVAEPQAPR